MKHVTLLPEEKDGAPSFFLLGPGGRSEAFDLFAKSLRKNPFNTIETYCHGAARFFDYFFEASWILGQENHYAELTGDQLVEALESYDDYLVYGEHSGNELAKRVAQSNPSPRVSPRTSEQLHAPLRRLLKLSEAVRSQMSQLARAGLAEVFVAATPLVVPTLAKPTEAQRAALYANSMLAGVISGGPGLLQQAVLPTGLSGLTNEVTEEQAFPFDLVEVLLENMTSHRDRALYAFCAASGCRISEALQLLWSDIDPRTMKVRLVNPKRRANSPSYLYLSPTERKKKLGWKARNTQATLLIEPFASIFFSELEKYRLTEWKWNEGHDFVFQHVSTKYMGRPYILSARSSRDEAFKKAQQKASLSNGDQRLRNAYGQHSLRHTYGFYLLNYFPRKDGTFGLPLGLVKQVMGHSLKRTTEVYARRDLDLIEEDMAYANTRLFGHGPAKSMTEVKRSILLSRLEQLESDMRTENGET